MDRMDSPKVFVEKIEIHRPLHQDLGFHPRDPQGFLYFPIKFEKTISNAYAPVDTNTLYPYRITFEEKTMNVWVCIRRKAMLARYIKEWGYWVCMVYWVPRFPDKYIKGYDEVEVEEDEEKTKEPPVDVGCGNLSCGLCYPDFKNTPKSKNISLERPPDHYCR